MSALAATVSPAPARASARDWIAVYGAILGAFTAILDIQITNASLASIQGALGASTEEGSWISTAYLMAEIIVIPLTGWLGALIGLRRYLVANTLLFVGFSLACALSSSLHEMILFRAGQGFTGGVLIPTAISIVRGRLPKSQQAVGIALFGFTATFAPAIGPTVGGWLTDNFSWRYVFYINLLIGPVAAAAQLIGLEKTHACWDELRHGDWPGIALMALGLPLLTFVLEEGQRKSWFELEPHLLGVGRVRCRDSRFYRATTDCGAPADQSAPARQPLHWRRELPHDGPRRGVLRLDLYHSALLRGDPAL